MVKLVRGLVVPLVVVFSLLVASPAGAQTPLPSSMASLGDSITRAADVCCWYGDHPHESWSTGDNPIDGIHSQYERLQAVNPAISGHAYNDAVSGAKASDLAGEVSRGGGAEARLLDVADRRQRPVYVVRGDHDVDGYLLQPGEHRAGGAASSSARRAHLREQHPEPLPIAVGAARQLPRAGGLVGRRHLPVDARLVQHRGAATRGGGAGGGVQRDPVQRLRSVSAVPLGRLRDLPLRLRRRPDQQARLLPPRPQRAESPGRADLERLLVGRGIASGSA